MQSIFGPFNVPQIVPPNKGDTEDDTSDGNNSESEEGGYSSSVGQEDVQVPGPRAQAYGLSDLDDSSETPPVLGLPLPSLPPSGPSSRAVSPTESGWSSAIEPTNSIQPQEKPRTGNLPIDDGGLFLSLVWEYKSLKFHQH